MTTQEQKDFFLKTYEHAFKVARFNVLADKVCRIAESHNSEAKIEPLTREIVIHYPDYGSFISYEIEKELDGNPILIRLHPSSHTLRVKIMGVDK